MPRPAVLALLLTLACARRPEDSLFYEETWEAFVLAPTGVIDVAARVSNRGLRRGLASMHARVTRPEGAMELLSEGPTTTVHVAEDHETLHLAGGSIGNDGMGAGSWRVMGSELSVVSFGTTWADNTLMSGTAVTVHRGGDALPRTPRRFLWAQGVGLSIGYDGEGRGEAAWIVKDGALVEADDAAITAWADPEIVLEIPSQRIVATFRPTSASAPEPIDWNSLRAERWLLSFAGIPTTRDLRAADAMISLDGANAAPARGLVLEER